MEEDKVNEAAKELSKLGSSKGGIARALKLSPEERSEIARHAVEARWEKAGKNTSDEVVKATHENQLKIGKLILPCAVLKGGVRVLTSKGFLTALGRPWKGTYRRTALPNFIGAKNLLPFISKDLEAVLTPLKYKNLRGQLIAGYKAELLPLICEVYLQARENDALTESQKPVAKQAEILTRGLSRVGIIALIDEVTGYQEVRDKLALHKILELYIAKELRPWLKTFPDEFYEHLFRLRGWQYKPLSVKRPIVVGKLTNDLIYKRLAPGILSELKKITPRDAKGRTKYRYFQSLTENLGDPKLREHLASVTTLMKASSNWHSFYRLLQRALPKYGDNLELSLFSDEEIDALET